MSKKAAAPGAGLTNKSSKGKGAKDAAVKDECVAFIIDLLFAHLDQHIKDKLIFPQTLAFAVGRTMAEVVHMVSIAHVQRMEEWLVHLEGSAPEEWDKPQEPLIPLIDSWARGVLPLKSGSGKCPSEELSQLEGAQSPENKQPRRASTMALSQYQDLAPRRRSSVSSTKQGLRGSLRRFSESLYPLDPNRKVKFQEKTTDDVQKDASSRRSSTLPRTEFFQGPMQEKGSSQVVENVETSSKTSLSQEDKLSKVKKVKASNLNRK
ncbi:hypothetical protein L7F22_046948 [Adiantum nelumboides]|nr:hypothetical protein [Adiantum nelumboides]